MKKKNIIIIASIALLVLVIGAVVFIKFFKKENKETTLIKLTKEFYSYYYDDYSKTTDMEVFLNDFKDSGLTVNLASMETYLDGKTGKKNDYSAFNNCDIDKTNVILYPKKPYTKNDVEIKVNLSCKK